MKLVLLLCSNFCDDFQGVANKEEHLTFVINGECPGDNDELSESDF